MEPQEAVEFLNALRGGEFYLSVFQASKCFASAHGIDVTDFPDGGLSLVVKRDPHHIVLKEIGSIKSIRWLQEEPHANDNEYIFGLESVALQGEDLIAKGSARTYDMHDDAVGSRLFAVELVMKEVTNQGKTSGMGCL